MSSLKWALTVLTVSGTENGESGDFKSDLFPIRVILKLKLNYFDFDSVFIGEYNFSRCTSKYKNVSFDLPRPVNSDYPNYEVLFVSL